MRATTRAWVGRGLVAVIVAVIANAVLSVMAIEHDAALVARSAPSAVGARHHDAHAEEATGSNRKTAWSVRVTFEPKSLVTNS